ncbi:MAG: hypothetical protein GW900_09445, partial [Gammaproteobacteria bacterium]|nr:hypothetical protein [Gammaproteobacteria bacterium]
MIYHKVGLHKAASAAFKRTLAGPSFLLLIFPCGRLAAGPGCCLGGQVMRKIWRLGGFVVLVGLLTLVSGCGGGGGSDSDLGVPVFIDDTQLNVATGTTVVLDRSGTIDAQGHTLSYHWEFTSLPPDSQPVLSDPVGARPTFIADKDGVYVAELTVTDETGASSIYTITVTASTTNSAPMANAGPNQNVATGTSVSLDGSASSDADGDPLTYSWSITSTPSGSSATLSDTSAAKPTFNADLDGNYVFSLIVNDGLENSAADSVTITSATANSAPVAHAGADQNVATGTRVTLDGSRSNDADGDPLTFQWLFTSRPAGSITTLSNSRAVMPTFDADVDGNYVLSLTVNDGEATSSADSVTITSATANSAPVANAGPDQNVTTGSSVSLNATGSSDADGDPLTYLWSITSVPAGSSATLSDTGVAMPSFTADLDGNYVFSLIVNDGLANSTVDSVTITAATAVPSVPTVTSPTGRV